MKSHFSILVALLLVSCGPSEADKENTARLEAAAAAAAQAAAQQAELQRQEAERLAEVKRIKDLEEQCVGRVAQVYNVMVNTETIDQVISSGNNADLSGCPSDFTSAFVGFVTSVSNVREALRNLESTNARAEDALKTGIGLGLVESLMGKDTGITPIGDQVRNESAAKQRLAEAAEQVASAKQGLVGEFMRHGFTVGAANAG
jgi:hypothetical protein